MPYGDFAVNSESGGVTEQTRYLDAGGAKARQDAGDASGATTKYNHGDMISSNVMTTGAAGTSSARKAYTAFGEAASGFGSGGSGSPADPSTLGTRYQYAGGWGYEAGLLSLGGATGTAPIQLSHVGARWYDAGSGRFVMRDPIGLGGGVNLYAYCENGPSARVDPTGFGLRELIIRIAVWVRSVVWQPRPPQPFPRQTPPARPHRSPDWDWWDELSKSGLDDMLDCFMPPMLINPYDGNGIFSPLGPWMGDGGDGGIIA